MFATIFYGGFTCITGYIDHQREFSTELLSSVGATSMDEVEWIVVRRGKKGRNSYTLVRNKDSKETVKVYYGSIKKVEDVRFPDEKWISRE